MAGETQGRQQGAKFPVWVPMCPTPPPPPSRVVSETIYRAAYSIVLTEAHLHICKVSFCSTRVKSFLLPGATIGRDLCHGKGGPTRLGRPRTGKHRVPGTIFPCDRDQVFPPVRNGRRTDGSVCSTFLTLVASFALFLSHSL